VAVAREAGIAAPSIYRHFASRNQLIEAVVAGGFQRLDDALLDAMTATPDPAAALRACCAAYRRFGLDHPRHYQVLFSANLALDPTRSGDRPGGSAAAVVAPRRCSRANGAFLACLPPATSASSNRPWLRCR
jgi:AcrR family transcriptional regulator